MEYQYIAYAEDTKLDEVWQRNTARKIKEPVTIDIKITIDRSKYEKIKTKYNTPIGQKILKMFE